MVLLFAPPLVGRAISDARRGSRVANAQPRKLLTVTSRSGLLANTAVAFVLAAIINSLLHELAHATAGLMVGLTPTVTPFSVDYQPTPTDA